MTTAAAEAVSTYESWRAFAAAWGLIFFGLIFLGVVAYVFWPSRQKEFERDAEIPFREDDNDV
jgi:cytochrome c oxidase cbb3-type subunit 4